MSSAICFNLDQSKILSSGNGLTYVHLSKLRAFTVNNLIVNQMMKIVIHTVENTVDKGENAGYQHFHLYPPCFQKASFSWPLKVDTVWAYDCLHCHQNIQ